MPASMFAGVPASNAAQLESTSMNWVVPTCSQEPGMEDGLVDDVTADSEPYKGRIPFYNYSGYLVFPAANSGNSYTHVEAQWDVPAVTSSTGDDQYTSSWVGLGSGKGEDSSGEQYLLDQAGTLQSVVDGEKTYFFFWELFPEDNEQLSPPDGVSLPAVSPGNAVEVDVIHNSANTSEFFLENLTTDQGTSFIVDFEGGYAEGGGQAEFIMERPIIGNQYSQLADFGTLTFRNMYVVNENDGTYYPGELTREQAYMTNCLVTSTLASPNNLVNGTAADNSGTIDWLTSGTGGDGLC
jgi:hypothetical protein